MQDSKTYSILVQKMRDFFLSKSYVEIPTQSRLSILAACENPHSVKTFEFGGHVWPLPQTGQMWLERELLLHPEYKGVFCVSTSYREEKDPIPGRHDLIFPMFEFEGRGGLNELIYLEEELLDYLGFKNAYLYGEYDDLCYQYNTEILESEHELMIQKDYGNIFFLHLFPYRTHPFWNMKKRPDGLYSKVDVILYGQETIGSAVRSTNVEEMRENFHNIEDGKYAKKLFELFGQDRVITELNDFLSLPMTERFGGGIGLTRMARAYHLKGK